MGPLISYLTGVAVGAIAFADRGGGYHVDVKRHKRDGAGLITEDYRVTSIIHDRDTLRKYLGMIATHPDKEVHATVWARSSLTAPRWRGVVWAYDDGEVQLHEAE